MNLRLQTPWVLLPTSYAQRDFRLSPDGRLVAVPTAPGPQGQLQVFDTSTGELIATGVAGASEWSWTRDSRYLVVAAGSDLLAWRIRDGNRTPLPQFDHYAQLAITQR
jgi:dipeptidyl aminopeptidase/acylaminoacyl peptidase